MSREDHLFCTNDLRLVIDAQGKKLVEHLNSLDPRRILATPIDDLIAAVEVQLRIDPLVLLEDQISVEQEDTRVDVRNDPNRFIRDRSRPALVPGTTIRYVIPFEGDPGLLRCQPSRFTLNPPRAQVSGCSIMVEYTRPTHAPSSLKAEFERDLRSIRSSTEAIAADVAAFNAGLRGRAQEILEQRRQKLLQDQQIVSALGFPVRKRDDAPATYVAPDVRRTVRPSLPPTALMGSKPEPTLDIATYEEILRIMRSMVLVMERSPKAFQTMGEEDIRQHFLVQLNGQFEGQATGETFNGEGKTDILIRHGGRNIFIAECKFWLGPKAFAEAIDQLLRYTTWRDTKTALVIFNRGRKLSTVLDAVRDVVRSRSELVREHPPLDETSFRYSLRQPGDAERELILTVLVFDIPSTKQNP